MKPEMKTKNKYSYKFPALILLSFLLLFRIMPALSEEDYSPDGTDKNEFTQTEKNDHPNEKYIDDEGFELIEQRKGFNDEIEQPYEMTATDDKNLESDSPEDLKDNKKKVLKGHVSQVPEGTKLKVILETPVDEVISMIDDGITAHVSKNVSVNGEIVIPAGSIVTGKISEINPAKRVHRAGSVRIEFKSLSLPDGREVPIVASILTHSGLIKGEFTKKSALISTATILGPAAAGLGAGLAADGSAFGAGVGAGLGLLAGIGLFTFQRGNMVDLMSGDELNIELVEEALVPVEGINGSKYCELK